MTPREQLDHCRDRFVTAALAGDDTAALAAFADAQALPAAGRRTPRGNRLGRAGTSDVEPAARRPARRDTEPGHRGPHPSPQPSCPVTALGIAFALGEAAPALRRIGQRLPGTATGPIGGRGRKFRARRSRGTVAGLLFPVRVSNRRGRLRLVRHPLLHAQHPARRG